MKPTSFTSKRILAVGAAITLAVSIGIVNAQPPAGGGGRGGSGRGGFGGGRGGGVAPALFTALDANKDGAITRDEMKSVFDAWYSGWDTAKTGALSQDQLVQGLNIVFPPPPAPAAPAPGTGGGFNAAGNSTPMAAKPADIDAMMAALPTTPGAKPKKARKVLVLARTGAGGFVHSSIPLAAKTVEALGNKGNLWTTTVSYDPADINTANLKQYDLIFLDSNTGCFLDDADKAVTAARRAAFLEFVRSGKGIAGIHAATDSYHSDCVAAFAPRPAGGGGRGGTGTTLAALFVGQADKNGDQKLSRQEFAALAETWFDKLDTEKAGKVSQADFTARFNGITAPAAGAGGRGGRGGEAAPILQWPEFNKLIGGYFKFHWTYPQLITTKIDDPKSPLTAMFHGKEFDIHDETYTFAQDSFSRTNVHVLTSIDYDKMSAADKAKEQNPRTDGDYALSYIRREGKGRVFYEAHGHDEKVYAMTPMLEHLRAGIQYALGDIKADDSPSKK